MAKTHLLERCLGLWKHKETENLLCPYVISVVSLLLLQMWSSLLICIYYRLLYLLHLCVFVTTTGLNCFSFCQSSLHRKYCFFPASHSKHEGSLAYPSMRKLAGHNPLGVTAEREGFFPPKKGTTSNSSALSAAPWSQHSWMQPQSLQESTGAPKFYLLENRKKRFHWNLLIFFKDYFFNLSS